MRMLFRILTAALAGAAGWWIGFQLLFMPAQAILADPALQSAKFIAVFAELPPVPRTAQQPWLLPAGFAMLALIQALVFALIRRGLPRGRVARGLAFGLVAWALCFPWFEFYLPWNVMHEPPALVALELLLWAGVMALAGLGISLGFGREREAG